MSLELQNQETSVHNLINQSHLSDEQRDIFWTRANNLKAEGQLVNNSIQNHLRYLAANIKSQTPRQTPTPINPHSEILRFDEFGTSTAQIAAQGWNELTRNIELESTQNRNNSTISQTEDTEPLHHEGNMNLTSQSHALDGRNLYNRFPLEPR